MDGKRKDEYPIGSPVAFIETCAAIFWERAEREISCNTCVYYLENNMERSLILLVMVEIGAVKYMMNRHVSEPIH